MQSSKAVRAQMQKQQKLLRQTQQLQKRQLNKVRRFCGHIKTENVTEYVVLVMAYSVFLKERKF